MNLRPKTDVVAEWLWEREFESRRGLWKQQTALIKEQWHAAARGLTARLMDFGFAIRPHAAYARVAVAPFEHDLEPRETQDDPFSPWGSGPVPVCLRKPEEAAE